MSSSSKNLGDGEHAAGFRVLASGLLGTAPLPFIRSGLAVARDSRVAGLVLRSGFLLPGQIRRVCWGREEAVMGLATEPA